MANDPPRLNVRTCTVQEYKSFMRGLRQLLSGDRMTHNRPVLRPVQYPIQFQDIILQTDAHQIRFRFLQHNLYLIGYQVGEDGPWMEFQPDRGHPRLIPESTFLGFGGGYPAIESVASRRMSREQAAQPRLGLPLGLDELANAVDVLAVSGADDGGIQRARRLIVIIQMISEALRFDSILNAVATRSSVLPDSQMEERETAWSDMSERLLRADADIYRPFRLPNDTIRNTGIRNAEEARDCIAMLLYYDFKASRRISVAGADRNVGDIEEGGKMVEVLGVLIKNIDGEDPGDLYGTITVHDGLGSQDIYNRTRDDVESIHPGDYALLTGPAARHITAYGSFTIDLNLFDKDVDPSPDDEISKGQIWWNSYEAMDSDYDQVYAVDVTGQNGSATVLYAILHNAVAANVQITLISGDGENPANVYGYIGARSEEFAYRSTLFSRIADNYVDVTPGSLIPLSRSIVAVPMYSAFEVKVDLYDQDSLSSDDPIANGTATFKFAQICGSSELIIKGKNGKISVKVTWDI